MSTYSQFLPKPVKGAKATLDWLGRTVKGSIPWLAPALAFWQIASQAGLLSPRILPAPTAVLKAAFRLGKSGELLTDIRTSTLRVALGFLIGSMIGLCLGILSGQFRMIANLVDGTVQMIRNIPHLALLPLVILWFGIGEEAKILLVVLGVFFPIYPNAYHGVRNVDHQLIEMARVYGLHGLALFRHVTLPGALTSILVGFRYALGIAWLTLIVAETIASTSGIGYLAMNAREFMQTDVVVLTILLYALLGKMSDSATKMLERRFLRWHPTYRK
jgi:sulfonate transport system permease protein